MPTGIARNAPSKNGINLAFKIRYINCYKTASTLCLKGYYKGCYRVSNWGEIVKTKIYHNFNTQK